MKKLYQLLGFNKPTVGLLGIEIEAEGRGMNAVHTNFWRSEDDGSLRGEYPETRAEFVLNQPIKQDQVVPALQELVAALPKAKFDFSYRTSVHVHVNVQDLNHTQILNMVYTYMLLEEPFMTYCGKARKGNRFCLRLSDAEGLLDLVQRMVKEGEGSHYLCGDGHRYSAINLAALNKYGSIEFRGMRGNIEIPVIHTWTRALVAVKEYAEKQESPKTIMAEIEKLGPKGFLKAVLGDVHETFLYPRMVKDMSRSYSISLDVPYSYKPYVAPREAAPGELVVNDNGDILWNGVNYLKNTNALREYHIDGCRIVVGLRPGANTQTYVYRNGNFNPEGKWEGEFPPLVAAKVKARPRAPQFIVDNVFE